MEPAATFIKEIDAMASGEGKRARDTGVGMRGVGVVGVVVLTIFLFAISILTLYSLMAFWPITGADGTIPDKLPYEYFGAKFELERERGLLLLVAIAGVAGAMAYVLRSFFKYVGERHLVWSWVPSYLLTPLVGSLLAVLTYIVVRAGLISGSTDVGNPFGFAAIAVLVGLFSAQAAEKLKQVFETMFAAAPPGSESIESAVQPTISGFEPNEGAVGETVIIHGIAIDPAGAVVFGGGISSSSTWDEDEGALHTTVPAGAETGPLSLTIGGTTVMSSEPFVIFDDAAEEDGVIDAEEDEPDTDTDEEAADPDEEDADPETDLGDTSGASDEVIPIDEDLGEDDDEDAEMAAEPGAQPADPIAGLPDTSGPDPAAAEGDPTAPSTPVADSREGLG